MAKRRKRSQGQKSKSSSGGGGWMTSMRTGFQRTVRGSPQGARRKKRSLLRVVVEILFWALVIALVFWGFSGGF